MHIFSTLFHVKKFVGFPVKKFVLLLVFKLGTKMPEVGHLWDSQVSDSPSTCYKISSTPISSTIYQLTSGGSNNVQIIFNCV